MTLFILGAGIGGGAHNVSMLIAGRTIQGLGSGGCMLFGDLVVADIAPLRERAKYFSIVLSTAAIGTIVGPIIGGALAQSSWRWCFYINLPLGFPCLVLMFFFLRLKYTKSPTWAHSLARIDLVGTLIFIPSVTAFAFGLVAGGQMYPWSSFRTILPIVLGGAGWICYHLYETSPFCKEPGLPPRVFNNRTSLAGYVLIFLGGLLLNWVCYFMPFYFQAVWGATPVLAGVYLLPLLIFMIAAGGVAGGIISKTGQYKPLHWVAFGMTSLGVGLFSILTSTSNAAEWVFFQIFTAIGLGFAMTSILPAINAGLEEKDVAAATAVFSFLKTLGFIWGVTIPSIIFNNQFDAHSIQISDESLRDRLKGGHAYSYAVSGYGRDITGQLRDEVVGVCTEAIKTVWYVAVAFALLGFLVVFVEKYIELRTELTTEYGIEERKQGKPAVLDAEKGMGSPNAVEEHK